MAAWKYFLIGLGLGIVGAILWIAASIPEGIIEGAGGPRSSFLYALMVVGFTAMFLGPLTFWIILPIRRAVKNRRSRSTGGGVL